MFAEPLPRGVRDANTALRAKVLHLLDVAALGEQPGGDGMAKGVEPGPLDTRLGARGRKHPFREIVRVEDRPGDAGENKAIIGQRPYELSR